MLRSDETTNAEAPIEIAGKRPRFPRPNIPESFVARFGKTKLDFTPSNSGMESPFAA